MHRINAKIGRAHPSDNRVEVRPIAIEIPTGRMDQIGNLANVALKQPTGIRVGQHDTRNIVAKLGFERGKVHTAIFGGRDRINRETARCGRCRVGPVGRFRHQNTTTFFTARIKGRPDRHHAAKFALCARCRRHGNRWHPGQNQQPVRTTVNQFKRALNRAFGLHRMQVGKTGHPRNLFIQARVMFHRARTQREEAGIDAKVFLRQAREMTHHLRLGQARKTDIAIAIKAAKA